MGLRTNKQTCTSPSDCHGKFSWSDGDTFIAEPFYASQAMSTNSDSNECMTFDSTGAMIGAHCTSSLDAVCQLVCDVSATTTQATPPGSFGKQVSVPFDTGYFRRGFGAIKQRKKVEKRL